MYSTRATRISNSIRSMPKPVQQNAFTITVFVSDFYTFNTHAEISLYPVVLQLYSFICLIRLEPWNMKTRNRSRKKLYIEGDHLSFCAVSNPFL